MDSHYPPTREELYHVQMDIRQLQSIQNSHSERLLRLEKRQADDAALKSVWNSPFPSVLSGTPQHGPLHTPSADVFDDFDDEHEQNILGSLQLEDDVEPVRRGASRANSVRFDVSAIQGSSWGQTARSSGEFAPTRPNSGFGGHAIERTLSHKSDGRQSSAGHSIHSIHSAPSASGRTSSLGLDANFLLSQDEDDEPAIPEPPPGLLILGSVPSIIRCWLDTDFSHNSLLYAVICTGSHKSLLDISVLEDLNMVGQIQRSPDGHRIRLPVYLPEAMVRKPSSRPNSPAPQLPALTVTFDIVSTPRAPGTSKKIRVFIGSETLRLHNADILMSQNVLTLYGDDRNKLTVPFVRPEDDSIFKHLRTGNYAVDSGESKSSTVHFTFPERTAAFPSSLPPQNGVDDADVYDLEPRHSPGSIATDAVSNLTLGSEPPDVDGPKVEEHRERDVRRASPVARSRSRTSGSPEGSRDGGIWNSWRQSTPLSNSSASKDGSASGAQKKAGVKSSRGMKVLKPSKISTSSEGRSPSRSASVHEASYSSRQPQLGTADAPSKWDTVKQSEDKPSRLHRSISSSSKTSNPIGGASAFAWMNPGKPKVSSAAD